MTPYTKSKFKSAPNLTKLGYLFNFWSFITITTPIFDETDFGTLFGLSAYIKGKWACPVGPFKPNVWVGSYGDHLLS